MADDNEPRRESGAGKVIALVFVLALAAFSIWLVNRIIADVRLQNCVMSGRRDCAPITPDTTPAR